jgi:hypothetical protein
VRLVGVHSLPLAQIFLVGVVVPLERHDLRVSLERKNMRGDAIEELPISDAPPDARLRSND